MTTLQRFSAELNTEFLAIAHEPTLRPDFGIERGAARPMRQPSLTVHPWLLCRYKWAGWLPLDMDEYRAFLAYDPRPFYRAESSTGTPQAVLDAFFESGGDPRSLPPPPTDVEGLPRDPRQHRLYDIRGAVRVYWPDVPIDENGEQWDEMHYKPLLHLYAVVRCTFFAYPVIGEYRTIR